MQNGMRSHRVVSLPPRPTLHSSMPTLRTVTLGCKVNQYETEYVREGLLRLGYEEAGKGVPADLCVVNTCTVPADGDLKSRKLIRQLARQNPGTKIIVMGCYATRAPDEIRQLPNVTHVVTDKRQLPELLAMFGLVDIPSGISSFGHRHRAFVKVQDGCPMHCSYCIIPSVRPILASRPVNDVLEEVQRLVDHGHREIVLTGIHLGLYGIGLPQPDLAVDQPLVQPKCATPSGDRITTYTNGGTQDLATAPFTFHLQRHKNTPTLADLLRRVVALSGAFRVRLSSLEAAEITPELLAVMAEHPARVCAHLHISVQSGSDRILARMRRRSGIAEVQECCQMIRKALEEPALTTDIIVGFPGESDEDFRQSCQVVERLGFSKVHVFRFSPREGTLAAEMPDQVPEPIKRDRANALIKLAERCRRNYFRRLTGRELQVLVESPLKTPLGRLVGTSDRYTPVELAAHGVSPGQLVRVVAGSVAEGRIQATVIAS